MKKLMKVLLPSVLFAMMAITPAMAEKNGSDVFHQRGCNTCHGEAGKGSGMSHVPKLAGQHKDYIVAQLNAFAEKDRNLRRSSGNSLQMIPFAAKLSVEEIDALATFLSEAK